MRCISIYRIMLMLFLAMLPPAHATLLEMQNLSVKQLSNVAVLEDVKGEWTLEHISSPEMADKYETWDPNRGQVNLGFSKSAYWIRFELQRQPYAPSSWVIEVPFFQLNTLDFFAPDQPVVQTGGSRPLMSRPFLHRFFAFPVEISTQPSMYYMRVTSHHSVTVPLTLWQEQPFRHHVQNTIMLQALYFGGLIALLIYNLFLSISLKDFRFFIYTLFVGVFGLGMLAGNGFGQMYLWPAQGQFDGIAQSFFLSLSGGFAMLFADRFLQAKRYVPKTSRWLLILAVIFFTDAAAMVTAPWHGLSLQWIILVLFGVTIPAGGLVVISGIQVLRMGHKGARFFLLAWLVLWSGAIIATLRAFEIIQTNTVTSYGLQLSSAIEMLLLALALADIVHLERQERDNAQHLALQANQQMLESARNSEERLEREVQKRTEDLESALNSETQFLKKYMRFGALISHEFRNPLGIVDSQISLLRKEYETGQLNLEKRLNTMASATQRLLSLFETWLHGDRLEHAMQEFAPQHIPLAAWLREVVDAQSLLRDKYQLVLKVTYSVGDVWADENLLEVAVLNLIDNACKYSEPGQRVVVEVRKKTGWVGIAVVDHGCGIDPENHESIFDDYHRVSSESSVSGMGLGLAFVRRITEKHQGELELNSVLGQGSSFCIWLPDK